MGIGGVSIWQLLIILAIVVLLFGTKRLRGIGGDLGSAIKSFRSSIKDEDTDEQTDKKPEQLAEKSSSAEPNKTSSTHHAEKDKH